MKMPKSLSPQYKKDNDQATEETKLPVTKRVRPKFQHSIPELPKIQCPSVEEILKLITRDSNLAPKKADLPVTDSHKAPKNADLPLTDSHKAPNKVDLPVTNSDQATKETNLPVTDSDRVAKENDLPVTDNGQAPKETDLPVTVSGQVTKGNDLPVTDNGLDTKESDLSVTDEPVTDEFIAESPQLTSDWPTIQCSSPEQIIKVIKRVSDQIAEADPVQVPVQDQVGPKPFTSNLQTVTIVYNGIYAPVKLTDPVLTYTRLQEVIFCKFMICKENQVIKVGSPPKVLEAPDNNLHQALPLNHDDVLTVENYPKKVKTSRASPHISKSAMDYKNELFRSYMEMQPNEFQEGGYYFEDFKCQLFVDCGHKSLKIGTVDMIFARSRGSKCIELCLGPLGHFTVSEDLESRIKKVQNGESVDGHRECGNRK